MIPEIGVIIGLYVILRYCEMFKNNGKTLRIFIILFMLITFSMMGGLLSH